MNTVSSKASAIVAMLISLISFGLTIASFVAAFTVPPIEHEMSRSFALWIYSMIVAFCIAALLVFLIGSTVFYNLRLRYQVKKVSIGDYSVTREIVHSSAHREDAFIVVTKKDTDEIVMAYHTELFDYKT